MILESSVKTVFLLEARSSPIAEIYNWWCVFLMWILFLYSPRPYDIDMIHILQMLKTREIGWLTQDGTVCTYQSQGLNPVLETLKHLFILLPSVASCMFISWEFSSYTAVVSKGNAMPWLRSWTSTSFVHAFNSRAPTTVCQAYSHRNKSVDKFRCSYLPKTSRIQPLVLPPGANSVSYITCLLATMLSPCSLTASSQHGSCSGLCETQSGYGTPLPTWHCSSAQSPSPTALCSRASTSSRTPLWFCPGHTGPLAVPSQTHQAASYRWPLYLLRLQSGLP